MENAHNPKCHFTRFQILKIMAQVPHYEAKLCKNQICPGTCKIFIFLWSFLLFWIPRTNSWNTVLLKIAPKTDNLAEYPTNCVEYGTSFYNVWTNNIMCLTKVSCRGICSSKWNPQIVIGIRKLSADSANCKRNPQNVSRICIIYVRGLCTRNPQKFCKTCVWNPGTYRHKIVRLSSAYFGLVMLTYQIRQIFNNSDTV